ncbi:MAG: galactose oxidase-like domain-containing protein [Planctomycetota bacterium]
MCRSISAITNAVRRVAVVTPAAALVVVTGASPPAQASRVGAWSPPVRLQIDGVHATLFHTGKVLLIPHRDSPSGLTTSALFDPTAPGGVKYQTVPQNFFCGGNAQLPDGRVLFVGGETNRAGASLRATGSYDPVAESWQLHALLKKRRWYASALQLGDGRVWAFGGMREPGEDDPDHTIEVYDAGADRWTLVGGQNLPGQFEEAYNRLHLLPDGRVFQSGHLPDTYLYDPIQRTWTFVARTVLGKARGDGAAVRLQDGRIMLIGGHDTVDVTNTAEIIDLSAPSPRWTALPNLRTQVAFLTAVLLPDGKVLAIGGDESSGSLDTTPELFDPSTNTWSRMARHAIRRGYHSTAILLPDARVLCAGGEGNGGPGLYGESDQFEIWSPPYLFRTPRPVIQSAPAVAGYGQQLSLRYASSVLVAQVVLHRAGSGTHSFNYNQISVPVALDANSGTSLAFTVPNNPNALPAGYYMAFLMSADGVPSIAKWIRIGPAAPPAGPLLALDGLTVGGSGATLTVQGLPPGNLVALALSVLGAGPLPLQLSCGAAQLELDAPVLLGLRQADASGRVALTLPVLSAAFRGLSLWFDALDFQTCASPAGVAGTIR